MEFLTKCVRRKGRIYTDLNKHGKVQGKPYLSYTKGSNQAESTIDITHVLEKSHRSQSAQMHSQDNSYCKTTMQAQSTHTLKHAYTPYLSATYTTPNIKWP